MNIQGLARKPEQLRKSQHGRRRRDGNAAKVGSVASRLEREVNKNKHRDPNSRNTEAHCGGHSDWGTVAWTKILAKRFYDPRKRFTVTLFLVTPR